MSDTPKLPSQGGRYERSAQGKLTQKQATGPAPSKKDRLAAKVEATQEDSE